MLSFACGLVACDGLRESQVAKSQGWVLDDKGAEYASMRACADSAWHRLVDSFRTVCTPVDHHGRREDAPCVFAIGSGVLELEHPVLANAGKREYDTERCATLLLGGTVDSARAVAESRRQQAQESVDRAEARETVDEPAGEWEYQVGHYSVTNKLAMFDEREPCDAMAERVNREFAAVGRAESVMCSAVMVKVGAKEASN